MRLPHAARSREEKRVVHALEPNGVLERPNDVLLTDDVGEASRAVLASENQVGHSNAFRCPVARASGSPGVGADGPS